MAKNNRVCKVCGSEYNFCPTCQRLTSSEKYKLMFCSQNCRDVFQVCANHTVGMIDKATAKEELSALDLSKQNQYSEKLKADIDTIMDNHKKSFKKKAIEEQVIIDEPAVIDTAIPTEF